MKTVLVLFALVAVVVCQEYYSSQYDNFDANELVNNIRLLKNYGKCFLGEGPCTPEAKHFKELIPETIRTTCGKCSPKQRELTRIVVKGFQTKLPDFWDRLGEKEDPEGKYEKAFLDFINSTD